MLSRRVTIIDIARELGISKSAVSNALHGRGRVSPETAQKVRSAAQRLGYVSNRSAQRLRASTAGAIGLYIPPIVRMRAFYMEFAFGVLDAATDVGDDVVLLSAPPQGQARRPAIDGAIVIDPAPADPVVHWLLSEEIPVVTAGRLSGPDDERVGGVIDAPHRELTVAVLDALLARGARRPAFLSVENAFESAWSRTVSETYREWMRTRAAVPFVRQITAEATAGELEAAVADIVADPSIDAVVAAPQGAAARMLPLLDQARSTIAVASLVGDETADARIMSVDLRPRQYGAEAVALLREVVGEPLSATRLREHAAVLRCADPPSRVPPGVHP